MVKPPTAALCRDAYQLRPVPHPLPHAKPLPPVQLWSRRTATHPLLSVPPRAWGLEETQPRSPSRSGTRGSLLLPAGPTCGPRVLGAAPSCCQLWRALQSGWGFFRSRFGVFEPPWHAEEKRGPGGAEGCRHGSPCSQNPEHTAGPQKGVGVSKDELQRRRRPL